MIFDMKIVYNI